MTAQEICNDALAKIGGVQLGQSASPEDSTLGLQLLNELQDTWNLEELVCDTEARNVYLLVANDGSYSVGPSGDFVGPKPTHAFYAAIMPTTSTREREIDILTRDEFNAIEDKGLSGEVSGIYIQNTPGPNATITLVDAPSAAARLVLVCKQKLTKFVDLTTDYTLPDGFERLYKNALAAEYAAALGYPLPEKVQTAADNAYFRLKHKEQSENVPEMDPTGNCPMFSTADSAQGVFS